MGPVSPCHIVLLSNTCTGTVEPASFTWLMRRKTVWIIRACELSEPILCYVFFNGGELCTGQLHKLSRRCELAGSNYPGDTVQCLSTIVNKLLEIMLLHREKFKSSTKTKVFKNFRILSNYSSVLPNQNTEFASKRD